MIFLGEGRAGLFIDRLRNASTLVRSRYIVILYIIRKKYENFRKEFVKLDKLNAQLANLLSAEGLNSEPPKDKIQWQNFLGQVSQYINKVESDREILSHTLEASTAVIHESSGRSQRLETEVLEGQAEIRAFIASTPLGLFLSDAEGRINYVNEHFCKIIGYSVEDSLRHDWFDLIHPEDKTNFMTKWRQMQKNPNATIHGDLRFAHVSPYTNEQKVIWCHFNMASINIRGVVSGFVGTIDDVQERKRAESLLEGEKQILEMMVRSCGQKVILESILQLIANQGFEISACVGQFTSHGKSVNHLASINLPASIAAEFEQLNVDREKFESSFRGNVSSGDKQIYNLARDPNWTKLCKISTDLGFTDQYALPIIDSRRHTCGIFIFFAKKNSTPTVKQLEIIEFFNDLFSITIEKASLEETLLQEQVRLISSSKMASLGEMAGAIAHEIMNPIAIIDGFAVRISRMIESGKIEKEDLEKANSKIRSTVDRITKIISSLRNYARDGESDEFAPAKIVDIVNDTMEFCRQKIAYRKIDLRIDKIDPDLTIDCQAVQISQVIINLLSNAADAVETLEERWIRLQVLSANDRIQIIVSDSGDGIRPEIQENIMRPYFTTKPPGKGTGLGLSISRSIAEGHGGDLFIDKSNRNTCFVLDLPIRQAISTIKAG